jgi:hypothetical protein
MIIVLASSMRIGSVKSVELVFTSALCTALGQATGEDTIIYPPLENLYGLIDILAE